MSPNNDPQHFSDFLEKSNSSPEKGNLIGNHEANSLKEPIINEEFLGRQIFIQNLSTPKRCLLNEKHKRTFEGEMNYQLFKSPETNNKTSEMWQSD